MVQRSLTFTSISLLLLSSACGGAPFELQAGDDAAPPAAETSIEVDAGIDAGEDVLKLSRDAEADVVADARVDAADALTDVDAAETSSDASEASASQPLCCHLATGGVYSTCAATAWDCCTGPLVNCDGATCAGTCSATAYTCRSPKCVIGQACLTAQSSEGIVESCQ